MLQMLNELGFSLVETGSFGQIRELRFDPVAFRTHKISSDSVLIGTSQSGHKLLIDMHGPRPRAVRGEIQIRTREATL